MVYSNKIKSFVSAIVYVYDNADKIYDFLEKTDSLLYAAFEKAEIICVNDASVDESISEINRYAETAKNSVTLINMSYHQGLEISLDAGVELSIGDFVYELESPNLVYPIDMMLRAYEKAVEGNDIVAVAPDKAREMTSAWYYRIYNRYSNSQYSLQTEAFRIVSRRAINRVKSMTKVIPYRKAIYANCGLKKAVLTFSPNGQYDRRSGLQKRDYRSIAIDSFILYTDIAFKAASIFSGIMMAVMVIVSIYAVIIRLQGIPVAGWTSTVLFLAFAFFGVFALMTAIIKYLSIILKLNFNRLHYVIESINKLK